MKNVKYIFVTGGVVSGLGKGITAASLGRLLKAKGYKVISQKLDPYINVDPGTMSPYQHGEVFVTEDGAETDLDLGHYERFIDENLTIIFEPHHRQSLLECSQQRETRRLSGRARYRSFRISPMKSRISFTPSGKQLKQISSSQKSAEPAGDIESPAVSGGDSSGSPWKWEEKTACLSMCTCCPVYRRVQRRI